MEFFEGFSNNLWLHCAWHIALLQRYVLLM